jgi:NAD(P)-dependent dehydrogenase (short-subunit alcohol dehydrogenase family)
MAHASQPGAHPVAPRCFGKIAGFRPQELPMQLSNARAVITGGVSGLGFAVARHLVAHGGKVALFDVNDDKGAAAVAELGEANARYFRTDVTDEAGVIANVDAARDFLGGLNVAINCAGILGAGRVLGRDGAMKLSQFQATVMVNLVGSIQRGQGLRRTDAGQRSGRRRRARRDRQHRVGGGV